MNTFRIMLCLAALAFIGGTVLGIMKQDQERFQSNATAVAKAESKAHAKTCREFPTLKVCQR